VCRTKFPRKAETLDGRLVMLSQYAVFQVNINSVLGSGVKDPEDALKIASGRGAGFTAVWA